MALYNKYRPYKLSMVCGQEHIKKILANQIIKNNLVHAYLFVGPAGTGKTTMARILAAMVNATEAPTVDTSLDDPRVDQIIGGRNSMDVFEMDAASTRGIDDIKEIRDKAYLSPIEMRKKVYIIDECHQLTPEAWGALLKILEEPPQHSIFVLCTTDSRKVQEAIKTRCQCFDFKSIPSEEMVKQVRSIAMNERIEIDDDALRMIVAASRGSLRNAISKLEKVNGAGERITANAVSLILGVTNKRTICDFVNSLIDGNILAGLKASSEAISIGVPPEDFFAHIASFNHDMMMFGVNGFDIERTGYLPEEINAVSEARDKLANMLGKSNFRKLLLKWEELLDKYAKRVVYRENAQKLVNIAFTALYFELKNFKAVVAAATEKGGAA